MSTYTDLIRKKVWARLRDAGHPEWQICTVYAIVSSGIKLKSDRTNELFIVTNNDVKNDLRLLNTFVPWEKEQQIYDGKEDVQLLLMICTDYQLDICFCTRFERWNGFR